MGDQQRPLGARGGIPSDIPAGSLKIAFFEKGRFAYDEESGLLPSSPLPSLPFPLSPLHARMRAVCACVRGTPGCVAVPLAPPPGSLAPGCLIAALTAMQAAS